MWPHCRTWICILCSKRLHYRDKFNYICLFNNNNHHHNNNATIYNMSESLYKAPILVFLNHSDYSHCLSSPALSIHLQQQTCFQWWENPNTSKHAKLNRVCWFHLTTRRFDLKIRDLIWIWFEFIMIWFVIWTNHKFHEAILKWCHYALLRRPDAEVWHYRLTVVMTACMTTCVVRMLS